MTDSDSAISTPPIISNAHRLLDIKAIAPNDAPMASEPVSPINTFAGFLLYRRKPNHEPAIEIQKFAKY